MTADLIPHKAMLARLRLSRTSVWRALVCGGDHFPKPVIVRRRMHWREIDLVQIARAMEGYGGRGAFDAARRSGAVAAPERSSSLAERKPRKFRRRKSAQMEPDLGQLDLFERR